MKLNQLGRIAVLFLLAMFAQGSTQATSSGDTVKALLMKMEREWDDTAVTKNAGVLKRILADDWTYWDTKSNFKTKAQVISELKASTEECDPVALDDLFVRVYANAAVVTGREAGKCRDVKAGSTQTSHQRFTDVFIKRNGRWQCVATHESPIADDKRQ
jgi:hypothetical protein